ncbi:unnamed protein product [Leptidea sinapis]|uniref:protein-tyrosine-phosphatase n=1 Tax=Leptidea sinapis TaxID=189913 RepID=A0A5E4Q9L0_9NEOP|nr:unnamed protein product [Leptidea sinapis]
MIENSGDVLRLLQPVPGRTCLRPHDIEQNVQNPESICGIDKEFLSLKIVDDTHDYSTLEGMKTENVKKNRYRNILPYDHTRVILRRRKESNESDYINANYIRPSKLIDSNDSDKSSNESLSSVNSLVLRDEPQKIILVTKPLTADDAMSQLRQENKFLVKKVRMRIELNEKNGLLSRNVVKDKIYIATQGCLSNTVNDFWQMIWQEDVRVISMVTNEVEKGKKKCERYWPEPGHEERYDELTVKSVAETFYEDYLMRELDVSNKTHRRRVYQYQFLSWPDQCSPPDPDGVLAFIEDINRRMYNVSQEKNAPEQNILCVHCSAGVGRTGTFIVLDILIDKMMSGLNCEIDVHKTVKLVRAQRPGMVQNKIQYRFIYLALQHYSDIDTNKLKIRKKVYTSEA